MNQHERTHCHRPRSPLKGKALERASHKWLSFTRLRGIKIALDMGVQQQKAWNRTSAPPNTLPLPESALLSKRESKEIKEDFVFSKGGEVGLQYFLTAGTKLVLDEKEPCYKQPADSIRTRFLAPSTRSSTQGPLWAGPHHLSQRSL